MIRFLVLVIVTTMSLIGCDTGPGSPRGFSLPEGDVERGEQVFRDVGCLSCHVVDGIETDMVSELEKPVKIGGKITRIKTYGELVTSIINPSHRIAKQNMHSGVQSDGKSKMRNYNEILTINQLIDLVTFLESRHELVAYDRTRYNFYYP